VFQLLEWWKTSKLSLVCPRCKEAASPEAFRRGRYLVGGKPLRCDHCGVTTPITLWRFEGLSHRPDLAERCADSRRSYMPQSPAS